MAVLAPPFILCPISESKELLGISEDREENKIIITLSKNIAIKYHVQEQKQEISWTSSKHWLTSHVIFCTDINKYGAIMDHNTVAVWDENDTSLSKIKKYKFSHGIHGLYSTKSYGTIVIFTNGYVKTLGEVIEESEAGKGNDHHQDFKMMNLKVNKILNIDVCENEEQGCVNIFFICESNVNVGKLSKSKTKPKVPKVKDQTKVAESKCGVVKRKSLRIFSISINRQRQMDHLENKFSTNDSLQITQHSVINIKMQNKDEEILGHCLISSGANNFLLFMGSDGYLYKRPLIADKDQNQIRKIANFETKISTCTPLVMRSLNNSSHVVFYACDINEEGAVVFIYDFNLDLFLSRQSLKLFSMEPIMEKAGNNVFIPVGMNILVLGLRMTKSQLSDILGQHQLKSSDFFETHDPWNAIKWEEDEDENVEEKILPKSLLEENASYSSTTLIELIKMVKNFENNGQPQSMICHQIIPEALEKNEYKSLEWILDYFDDIPEELLVRILSYFISKLQNEDGGKDIDEENVKKEVNQIIKRKVENKVLIDSFRCLDFTKAKIFLIYLTSLLQVCGNWKVLSDEDEEQKEITDECNFILATIKWISALLDSHYIDFVYNDETELVNSILEIIEDKLIIMKEIENIEPLLRMTLSKISIEPKPSPNSKFRTETIIFE